MNTILKSILLPILSLSMGFNKPILDATQSVNEEVSSLTIESQASYQNNDTYYVYVKGHNISELSSLSIELYTDNDIEIKSFYSFVESQVIGDYNITKTSNDKTLLSYNFITLDHIHLDGSYLFYFSFSLDNVNLTSSYFDLIITDANDVNLNPLSIKGDYKTFVITNEIVTTNVNFYSTVTKTSLNPGDEFSIKYYSYDLINVSSGSFNISYDPSFFKVKELIPLSFIDEDTIFDYNLDLKGTIYASFLKNNNNSSSDIFEITFEVIGNQNVDKDIIFKASDLYDNSLNVCISNEVTNSLTINYDPSFGVTYPSIYLEGNYDLETFELDINVKIEENSYLGAGDFEIRFNQNQLKYLSSAKLFNNFGSINDKNVSSGLLKFNFLTLEDLLTSETLISIKFKLINPCTEDDFLINISGNNLTNSLTESINLSFKNFEFYNVGKEHNFSDWEVINEATCLVSGKKQRKCLDCGSVEEEIIDALGHSFNEWVTTKEATCTEKGLMERECSICHYKETKEIDLLPHEYMWVEMA